MLSQIVPIFHNCYRLYLTTGICVMDSSLVQCRIYTVCHLSFSLFVIKACGIVFVQLFLTFVFCFIISIVFFSSSFFSFKKMSRSFLSVLAVVNFEMSTSSADNPLNAQSFSISISQRQRFSSVSASFYLVQKNFL